MREINEQVEERVMHVAKPQKHNFDKVELEYTLDRDYYFLGDDLENNAIEYLGVTYEEYKQYFSLTYSLSNCQGDGVGFRKGESNYIPLEIVKKILPDVDLRKLRNVTFWIQTNGYATRYSHEDTFYIDCYLEDDYNETKHKYAHEVANDLTEKLRDVCKQLESDGYKCIEAYDEEQDSRLAFEEWKVINDVKLNELYEYDYTLDEKEATDEYTHVATDGDTYYSGLWVKLPKLKQVTKAYVTTKEVVSYEVEK